MSASSAGTAVVVEPVVDGAALRELTVAERALSRGNAAAASSAATSILKRYPASSEPDAGRAQVVARAQLILARAALSDLKRVPVPSEREAKALSAAIAQQQSRLSEVRTRLEEAARAVALPDIGCAYRELAVIEIHWASRYLRAGRENAKGAAALVAASRQLIAAARADGRRASELAGGGCAVPRQLLDERLRKAAVQLRAAGGSPAP